MGFWSLRMVYVPEPFTGTVQMLPLLADPLTSASYTLDVPSGSCWLILRFETVDGTRIFKCISLAIAALSGGKLMVNVESVCFGELRYAGFTVLSATPNDAD